LLIKVHCLDQPASLEVLNAFGEQEGGRCSSRTWRFADRGGRFKPGHLATLLSIHGRITSFDDSRWQHNMNDGETRGWKPKVKVCGVAASVAISRYGCGHGRACPGHPRLSLRPRRGCPAQGRA